jgi:septal ring factor EnvC (AmiA/AmiB activator)
MAKKAEVQKEDEMNTPKFDRMLLIPIGISIVGIILILFVFMYYMNRTDNNFSILASMIEQCNSSMDSVKNNISALSQQLNITAQNSLQQINSLKESNANLQNQLAADENKIAAYEMKFGNLTANLQNQLGADEKKFDNLTAYVNKINQTCTNTTTIIYINQTAPVQNQTSSVSCRQALMNKYGLGPEFDVVACCNRNPPVGYWQECCACYE